MPFCAENPFIYTHEKGVQKVYEKLLAHPLFISDYVVYYARVGADVRMCVCVCVLHFYLVLPNKSC